MTELNKAVGPSSFLPPMVSFAQNFEDVLLRRALRDVECGFYVDIGAFDPVVDSVTAWFYAQGWRGVNVEPNPTFHRRLLEARPEDISLQMAVTDGPGLITLHLMDGLSTTVSTVVDQHAARGREVSATLEVETIGLEALLTARSGGRVVDFLNVDVEGAEGAVLKACPFEQVRPRIIVAEATAPDSPEPAQQDWEAHIIARGYIFATFDGLNRYFVRQEDAWRVSLLATPVNVFDNFRIRGEDYRVAFLGTDGTPAMEPDGLCGHQLGFWDFVNATKAPEKQEIQSMRTQILELGAELASARTGTVNDQVKARILTEENKLLSEQVAQLTARVVSFVEDFENLPHLAGKGTRVDKTVSIERSEAFEHLRHHKAMLLDASLAFPAFFHALRQQKGVSYHRPRQKERFRDEVSRFTQRLGRSIRKRLKWLNR